MRDGRIELAAGDPGLMTQHTCSGKHAGFLALCRAEGWPVEGYRHADHPCQRAMLTEVAAVAEVDPRSIPVAVDGCGVPTFGLSLERAALAFGRLRSVDGGRVVRAIRAYPELLTGPLATDARFLARSTAGSGRQAPRVSSVPLRRTGSALH